MLLYYPKQMVNLYLMYVEKNRLFSTENCDKNTVLSYNYWIPCHIVYCYFTYYDYTIYNVLRIAYIHNRVLHQDNRKYHYVNTYVIENFHMIKNLINCLFLYTRMNQYNVMMIFTFSDLMNH